MADASFHSTRLRCRLYLEAVLPTLAALVRFDPAARDLVSAHRFGIRFCVPGLPSKVAIFDGEHSGTENRKEVPTLSLWLPSAGQCVRLFSKTGFALPIPVGGFPVATNLGRFQQLTERMEAVLTPNESDLTDPDFLRIHVFLSLHLAVHALVPMLEEEPVGREVWTGLPEGVAEFAFARDQFPAMWLDARGNRPVAGWGPSPEPPRVSLEFKNEEAARLAMASRLDSLAALGRGDLVLRGFVPMADALDLVMQQIQAYLLPAS